MKYAHVVSYVADSLWAILPSKLSEIMAVLALRASGGEFTAEEIQARIGSPVRPTPSARGAVAVVPLWGVIAHRMGSLAESSGGMSAERFAATIRSLASDTSIGTVLIDVNSPGGTITGVPEAAQAVYDLAQQKRVVAIANGPMASAAYWIASQAQELVAVPSLFDGAIGSIGVFSAYKDVSAALEKEGVTVEFISAGEHKLDGNGIGPLTPEHRARVQASVDQAYGQFVKDVARGRGVSAADVRGGYGQGAALSATEAKAAGLVDRIATFDDTLARLTGARGAAVSGMAASHVEDEGLVGSKDPEPATEASLPPPEEPRDAVETDQVLRDQQAILAAVIACG